MHFLIGPDAQRITNGARHEKTEKYTGTYKHTKENIIMIKAFIDRDLDAFIRGVLDDIPILVETLNPKHFNEAFE